MIKRRGKEGEEEEQRFPRFTFPFRDKLFRCFCLDSGARGVERRRRWRLEAEGRSVGTARQHHHRHHHCPRCCRGDCRREAETARCSDDDPDSDLRKRIFEGSQSAMYSPEERRPPGHLEWLRVRAGTWFHRWADGWGLDCCSPNVDVVGQSRCDRVYIPRFR